MYLQSEKKGPWRRLPSVRTMHLLVGIVYVVGIVGLWREETRALFQALTPLNLLLGAMVLFFYHQGHWQRGYWVLAGIALGGFGVEWLGVQTGMVFGHYVYGPVLGWSIGGTPLLIGLNWLMLCYIIWELMGRSSLPSWSKVPLGAAAMVLYDLPLEQVAMRIDMWQWAGNGPPLQNFVGWFVVSGLFFALMQVANLRYRNPMAGGLLAAQFLFFVLLYLLL